MTLESDSRRFGLLEKAAPSLRQYLFLFIARAAFIAFLNGGDKSIVNLRDAPRSAICIHGENMESVEQEHKHQEIKDSRPERLKAATGR